MPLPGRRRPGGRRRHVPPRGSSSGWRSLAGRRRIGPPQHLVQKVVEAGRRCAGRIERLAAGTVRQHQGRDRAEVGRGDLSAPVPSRQRRGRPGEHQVGPQAFGPGGDAHPGGGPTCRLRAAPAMRCGAAARSPASCSPQAAARRRRGRRRRPRGDSRPRRARPGPARCARRRPARSGRAAGGGGRPPRGSSTRPARTGPGGCGIPSRSTRFTPVAATSRSTSTRWSASRLTSST